MTDIKEIKRLAEGATAECKVCDLCGAKHQQEHCLRSLHIMLNPTAVLAIVKVIETAWEMKSAYAVNYQPFNDAMEALEKLP